MESTGATMKYEGRDADVWAAGFIDGLKFVAIQLNRAADQVEQPQAKHTTGQPYFARKLRELAREIESHANLNKPSVK